MIVTRSETWCVLPLLPFFNTCRIKYAELFGRKLLVHPASAGVLDHGLHDASFKSRRVRGISLPVQFRHGVNSRLRQRGDGRVVFDDEGSDRDDAVLAVLDEAADHRFGRADADVSLAGTNELLRGMAVARRMGRYELDVHLQTRQEQAHVVGVRHPVEGNFDCHFRKIANGDPRTRTRYRE